MHACILNQHTAHVSSDSSPSSSSTPVSGCSSPNDSLPNENGLLPSAGGLSHEVRRDTSLKCFKILFFLNNPRLFRKKRDGTSIAKSSMKQEKQKITQCGVINKDVRRKTVCWEIRMKLDRRKKDWITKGLKLKVKSSYCYVRSNALAYKV